MVKGTSQKLTFPISFDGTPDQEIKLNAYLFSRSGMQLATAHVVKNEVVFNYKGELSKNLRIFIAPHIEEKIINIKSIDDLTRLKAYEPVINLDSKGKFHILPIPEYYWRWWCWKWCRVRGRVVKDFNFNGVIQEKPICNARIHICEVDKLCFWIYKIPNHIIDKIRKNIVEGPVKPKPGDPVERLIELDSEKNIFAAPVIQKSVAILPDDVKSKFMVNNHDQIRNAIVDHFELLHPYFCYWPWFWPWFYRCSSVDTVYSDTNGYFDTSFIHFLCCYRTHDNPIHTCCDNEPDLYFWIEYEIDGVWTTVYRPCLPTNTFWDYVCGSEITIRITDTRVPWGCHNQIEGDIVWVKSIGGGASVTRIEQNNVATNAPAYNDVNFFPSVPFRKIGLSDASVSGSPNTYGDNRRPFGGIVRFIVQFGNGFPANGIKYYRWSYLKTAYSDLSPTGNTTYKQIPVSSVDKSYNFFFFDSAHILRPGGTSSIKLGPLTVGAEDNLCLIPPNILPGAAAPFLTNPAVENNPWWDYDTQTISFDTNALEGDGLYDFKLELFDAAANSVQIPKTGYNIPVYSFPSPEWDASLSIWRLSQQAPDNYLVPGTPLTNAAAYHMQVRVDNNPAEGSIAMVEILSGGIYVPTAPNCCGFIQYNPADFNNDNLLKIGFNAYHHYNFADLSFAIQRGTCNDATQKAATDTAAMVMGNTNNAYQRDAAGNYFKTFSPATLLGTCAEEQKAAFAETLTVQPLAINGDSQTFPNVPKIAAFAIEPIAP